MTDNEIIKAFKDCNLENATLYLYNEKEEKVVSIPTIEIFNLINRQKAENEALRMDNKQLQDDVVNANLNYEALKEQEEKSHQYCKNVCEPKYKAEIERLQGKRIFVDKKIYDEQMKKENIRAEAVKEFAERLKKAKYISKDEKGKLHILIELDEFDNLLKERVGEGK